MKSKTTKIIAALLSVLIMIASLPMASVYGETIEKAEVAASSVSSDSFSWDNATVYALMTDRFNNGNTINDHSYNRGLNQDGSIATYNNVGAFQGGDFKGITNKIQEGYFDSLGINVLNISGWFEQTHGYVVGGDGKNSFAHYAYHGCYGLDFTELDKNFGTEAEFKEMIDTAHSHGIRIVLNAELNHPGYNSLYDMAEYSFGTLNSNWSSVYYNWNNINQSNYHSTVKYNDGLVSDWARWWGKDWIRVDVAGYDSSGFDDLTTSLTFLPDFKTESSATVSIPKILETKWTREGTLTAKTNEINQTITKYNLGNKTVSNYLVSWYAKWVEEYGVDGFFCDLAKHVDKSVWEKLSDTCTKALKNWRAANPNAVGADWDEDFWTVGEHFGKGLDKDDYYTTAGFDSMINFSFSGDSVGNNTTGFKRVSSLNNTYADYAGQINSDSTFNALTYVSSHDTGLCRDDLYYQGSALLLLPGGVQIFYGDETNRPLVDCTIKDHRIRGFMNWSSMDKNILAHWQKIGQFRNNHIAVGAGSHQSLTATSGTAFARTYSKNGINDVAVCVIGANKNTSTTITLNNAFTNGTEVKNAYTGDIATVAGGKVTFNSGAQGTILVEVVSEVATEPVETNPTIIPPIVLPTDPTEETETTASEPVYTIPPVILPTDPTEATETTVTDPEETTVAESTVTEVETQATTLVPEKFILGDVNGDGEVDINDVTIILKILAKFITPSDSMLEAADFDDSMVVNIKDATKIQKYLAIEREIEPGLMPAYTPGVVVDGKAYNVEVGDKITYRCLIDTPENIECVQAYVEYDPTKLQLIGSDVVSRFSNMVGVVAAEREGMVVFNSAQISRGFDFTNKAVLVELQFIVLDESGTEIVTFIEELTEYFGEAYVVDGWFTTENVKVSYQLERVKAEHPTSTAAESTVPEIAVTTAAAPSETVTDAPETTVAADSVETTTIVTNATEPTEITEPTEEETTSEVTTAAPEEESSTTESTDPSDTQPLFEPGDVNQDNKINIKDVTTIQKFLAKIVTFNSVQTMLADYNGDGIINIKDATLIQKKLANLI